MRSTSSVKRGWKGSNESGKKQAEKATENEKQPKARKRTNPIQVRPVLLNRSNFTKFGATTPTSIDADLLKALTRSTHY